MLVLGLGWQAVAETNTWQGTTTNWATGGNWSLGVPPTSTHDVVIDGGGSAQPTLSLAGGATTINSLSIGATIASTLTLASGDESLRRLVIAGSCTVGPTGVLTHADNTTNEAHKLNVEVQGNLSIQAGGLINVVGLGYDADQGPGAAIGNVGGYGAGGGYGGEGGDGHPVTTIGGTTYGSPTNPVRLGSGGDTQPGGGAAIVRVAGQASIDGAILADGAFTAGLAIPGGAGGSVFLTAGTLSGSGAMSAIGSGGTHARSGQGGGGRIAVVLTNSADFGSVTLRAYGGHSSGKVGGAGTIWKKGTNDTYGVLIVDNAGYASPAYYGYASTLVTNATLKFDDVICTNRGVLELGSGAVLDLSAGGGLHTEDGSIATNLYGRLVISAGQILFPPAFTLGGCISQRGTNALTFDTALTIASNGVLAHELYLMTDSQFNYTAHETNKLNVTINGALTVRPGGQVGSAGSGYASGWGPGVGAGTSQYGPGGGHGGEGNKGNNGTVGGTTYDSIVAPSMLGSGGAVYSIFVFRGGGSLTLRVRGPVTNNGLIHADAERVTITLPGCAGGSVFLTCASLAGSGEIRANGNGTSTHTYPGQGGGGRVAVVLTNGSDFGAVTFQALTGTNNVRYGGAGTIYLKRSGETRGTLIVDNANWTSASAWGATLISSQVTDAAVGHVVIRNAGKLQIDDGQTFAFSGELTNNGTLSGDAGSVLCVDGGGTSVLAGTSATMSLSGLSCTNGGKTILFKAGSTYTVSNALQFAGSSGNLLALGSMSSSSQWFLVVTPGAAQSVSYVDVSDSNADGGDSIATSDSHDGGNNSHWEFATAGPVTWTGASSTNWAAGANWDLGRPPIPTDTEVIIPSAANQPVLDTSREIFGDLTIASGASLTCAGHGLTVHGQIRAAGTLAASMSETIRALGDVDFSGGGYVKASSSFVLGGAAAQAADLDGQDFHLLIVTNDSPVSFGSSFSATELRCERPGASLTFPSGATCAVARLKLAGASGDAIELASSAGGAAWRLRVSEWSNVKYIDVSDADASGGLTVYAIESNDGGGNTNWDFGPWVRWTGAGSADFTNASNWAGLAAPGTSDYVAVDGQGLFSPVISSPVTVRRLDLGPTQPSTLTVNADLVVTEDLTVYPDGVLTHGSNSNAEVFKLNVGVGRDLRVHTGGRVDANNVGYAAGYGPGAGPGSGTYSSGAGYGGEGASGNNSNGVGVCYGSFRAPSRLGSGSPDCPGGGAIRLNVAGALTVDGLVRADASMTQPDGRAGPGGSGGSVWITAASIDGSGSITARGGGDNHQYSGQGGGGRVALVVGDGTGWGGVTVRVNGGSIRADRQGAGGTVYFQNLASGRRYVSADNAGYDGVACFTELPPAKESVVAELQSTPFVITNRAEVVLTTNAYAGDLLIYTNCSLTTGNSLLYVAAREHNLENVLLMNPGPSTNRVDHYANIVWVGPPPGLLIIMQ